MEWEIVREYPSGALLESWRACAAASTYPSHYVTPEYFREPFFGADSPFALLARDGDTVHGVATGIIVEGRLQCGLGPRPQACVRIGSDEIQVGAALAQGLVEVAERADAGLVTVYAWSPMPGLVSGGFRERPCPGDQGTVVLDLSAGPEALFRGFSENRRTNIRKAMKGGLDVAPATSRAEIHEYYPIYADWCRRKGHVPQAEEAIVTAFSLHENRQFFMARHAGRIVAGAVVRFTRGGVLEYAANSSVPNDQKLRPNDLLHWRIVEWACRERFTFYNLGGAHLFLRKFGGEARTTYRYRLDRTLFRRHDLLERTRDWSRGAAASLPAATQRRLRRLLGKAEGDRQE